MKQDFIALRMDEFARLLATIAEFKKAEQWDQVIKVVGENLGRLLGVSPKEFRKLTETGLLAQLIKSGPMATVWVPYKQIILIALLKEAGDIAAAKDPIKGGSHLYLKALHLLFDALAHGELQKEYAHLVPTVETLLTVLKDSPLPQKTRLGLMREYERRGLSAQAREDLKAALEKR